MKSTSAAVQTLARALSALGVALFVFTGCAAPGKGEAPEASASAGTPAGGVALATVAPVAAPASVAAPAVEAKSPEAATLERVVALGRSDNRVQQHLWQLCNEIGPRLTASHQLQEACEWARDVFASFGLTSRLERWGEFPVGFDRGPRKGRMSVPEEMDLDFTTPAWTPGTNGALSAAAVLYPSSEEELEAARPRLAGAWIVQPRWGRGERPAADLRRTIDAAIAEAGPAGTIRSSGSELVHTGGNYQVEWDPASGAVTSVRRRGEEERREPVGVTVVLRDDQHAKIVEHLKAGTEVELELSIDNRFFEGPVPLYNVIADLVGTEKPDEYVYVGGHIDSWDGAQGTVDNGTGVATTIEAARLLVLAGAKPKRTIRFALWSGEEQGLLGSRAYVEAHPELWPKISAVLIHDGGTNYLSGLNVTPQMQPAMEAVCEPLIALNPELPFELKVLEEGRGLPGGGSDHQSFIAKGVPGFFWNQSGRSDYNHHHHTQHDNFDAAIPEYQEHSAIVVALTALQLADQPELLDRTNVTAPSGRGGPRRRLGVQFEDTTITEVIEGGKAAEAGWKVGDVLLTIDGAEVADQREVFTELRRGEGKKVFKLKRGEEVIESTIEFGEEGGERAAPREGAGERPPARD